MIRIFEFQGIAPQSFRPPKDTWSVKVDCLPIGAAPQDGRILEELSADETTMTGRREVEGIVVQLGNGMSDHSSSILHLQADLLTGPL